MVVSKKENISEVVYIESIVFLMQTLVIQIQFTHFLKVASFAYHLSKVLNTGVTKVHYIFSNEGFGPSVIEEPLMLDFSEAANRRKEDRLESFKRQDVLVGSTVGVATRQKVQTVKLTSEEANWQFSSKMVTQSEWRIFIKNYQSSPLELLVSAINERLKKQKKLEKTKEGYEESKKEEWQDDEVAKQAMLI